MGLFDRKPRRPVFTSEEMTTLVLLAASIESLEQLGLAPNHQMNAIIEKAKSVCVRTETENGFNVYCPPLTIVY